MNEWNALLGQLGERLGMDGLRADEQGYCALSIDDGWVLHLALVPERQCVQCMAELGALPAQGREDTLARMLHANALFAGTDGATLGLDAARGTGVLSRELALAGLDLVAFEDALERFVLQAERWTQWLRQAGERAAAPAPAPAPATGADAGAAHTHWMRG